MMLVSLVFMLVFSGVVHCDLHYADCGSVKGKITSVTANGCGPGPTCILHRGTNVTINVGFESLEVSDSCVAVVHGVIAGIPAPFHLPQPNGCLSGVDCPLKAGATYDYSATLPIKSMYPPIGLKIKWELKDGAGNEIFCFLLPAHIS